MLYIQFFFKSVQLFRIENVANRQTELRIRNKQLPSYTNIMFKNLMAKNKLEGIIHLVVNIF